MIQVRTDSGILWRVLVTLALELSCENQSTCVAYREARWDWEGYAPVVSTYVQDETNPLLFWALVSGALLLMLRILHVNTVCSIP